MRPRPLIFNVWPRLFSISYPGPGGGRRRRVSINGTAPLNTAAIHDRSEPVDGQAPKGSTQFLQAVLQVSLQAVPELSLLLSARVPLVTRKAHSV
jgi:hypothetical protein